MAAICPATGESVGLLSPYVNNQIMSIFLKQFSRQLAKDIYAVLIWDQAGFHKYKELSVPANISIIELPSYSPELNPVENLWQYLRSHYWSNRSYGGYDDLHEAACESWQAVCLDLELIRSICRCSYVDRNNLL